MTENYKTACGRCQIKQAARRQRKHILGSLIFLTGAAIILLHIAYLLRPTDSSTQRQVFPGFYAEEKNSLDVVFIGSSAIYRYVDSPYLWKKTGITSYNLATMGMPYTVYPYMIEEVLKSQDPDLIVLDARSILIDADSEYREEAYYHAVSDNMSYSLTRLKMIINTLPKSMSLLDDLWDLNRFHDNWEQLSFSKADYADNERVSLTKRWSSVFYVEPFTMPDYDLSKVKYRALAPEKISRVRSLFGTLEESGRQVLILETPYRRPEQYAGRSLSLQKLAEEYGIPYLDLNACWDEIGLSSQTDFYNTRHANFWGARKVTEYLGNYLLEHEKLDLTHSEEVNYSWKVAAVLESNTLKRYLEKMEKS